jgi:hypothetical protein
MSNFAYLNESSTVDELALMISQKWHRSDGLVARIEIDYDCPTVRLGGAGMQRYLAAVDKVLKRISVAAR